MNLDFICIVLSSLFVYMGYSKGLIAQLSKLFAGIGAYFIAKLTLPYFHHYLIENHILSENTSSILSFILLLILIFIGIKFLSSSIETFLKSIGLNFTNRIAGAIFGLFTAVLILSPLAYLLVAMNILSVPPVTKDFSYFQMLYQTGSMLIKSYLN